MANKINLNKENSVVILSQYVEHAQTSGAFALKEASLLKKAIDQLNKDVKEKDKPDWGPNVTNPEATAIGLLIQGVTKGQAHGKSYNLNDAALICDIIEFLQKEAGVAEQTGSSQRDQVEDSDAEDENDGKTRTIQIPSNNKGKGRAE